MKILKVKFEEIKPMIQENIESNKIIVDSFWEQHVIESSHYAIHDQSVCVGYFSIHNRETITGFYMRETHLQFAKDMFAKAKRFEQVTNAMVATGDEIFLSNCLDNYVRLEKQAYFSVYRDEAPDNFKRVILEFCQLTKKEELEILNQAGDFFKDEPLDKLFDEGFHYKIYSVYHNKELIGFGVVEKGRILRDIASIGMYVLEEKRQMGYAKNILRQLSELVKKEGYIARSGCWYYNHNSLKSMEGAGAYSRSRLLRFYF